MSDEWRAEVAQILSPPYIGAVLDGIDAKILAIHAVRDSRLEPHVIEFATAEAVFWLSAIDEALWAVSGYEEARDADEAGRLFDALRLARNGAAHSLLVPPTRPADIRAFIGGPDDDYAFYISEAARWQFEPPDVKQLGKRHQAQVRAYLELLARKPVTDALAAAT